MSSRLTRTQVIARLRAYAAGGRSPSSGWLMRNDPVVYRNSARYFDTIAEARAAAGTSAPERPRKWSRARVIDELKRLGRRRLKITISALNRAGYSGLVRAATAYVGSFRRARRLAGIPDPPQGGYKRERWDDDRVIHEIRERHRSNRPLAQSKAPSKLVSAAFDHCGGWRQAIEMAGLDYNKVRLNHAPRHKEEIVAAIRQVGARVGPTQLGSVVYQRARQLFGDLRNATTVAGLDPDAVVDRKRWRERDVAAELQRLARERPSMTTAELRSTKVGAAAERRYGDLPKALERLGIRDWPTPIRISLPSRTAVLSALHARRRRGASMRWQDVEAEEPRIARAAYKRFGSFRAAMQAAGLRVIGREQWTDERILNEIRRRHRDGLSLAASKTYPKLRHAAIQHFGSWASAIEKAGLDYSAVRLTLPRSETDILAELRAAAKSGRKGVGADGFIDSKLAFRAHHAFGGLRAAILAAGLDPKRLMHRHKWTDEELATELRDLARTKPMMTLTELQRTSIGQGAIRRYESIPAAMQALRIRAWPRQLRRPLPSREELLQRIERRHQRGETLRQMAVVQSEPRLVKAALKHFGTWRKAMQAAGLGSLVGRPSWSKAKVLTALKARHARGAPLNSSAIARDEPSLASAVGNHFGGVQHALRAARLLEARGEPRAGERRDERRQPPRARSRGGVEPAG